MSGSLADSARALEIYERLAAERPDSGELRAAAAEAQLDLATTHFFYEQLDEAHPLVLKALASLEALARAEPSNVEAGKLLSRGYTLRGSILFWNTREREADAEMTMLGLIALHTEQPGVATPHLAKSAAEFEELERVQPKNRTYRHDIARVATYLGLAKYQQRDFEGALAGYRKAVALYEDDLRADPQNMLPFRKLASVHTTSPTRSATPRRRRPVTSAGRACARRKRVTSAPWTSTSHCKPGTPSTRSTAGTSKKCKRPYAGTSSDAPGPRGAQLS